MSFVVGILAGSLIGIFVMSLFAVGAYRRGVEDAEELDDLREAPPVAGRGREVY